jgi:hypothetical protein
MTAKKPAAKKADKKPHGRPSLYTQPLGKRICDRLSKGEPLAQICRDAGMPAVRTVSLWKESHPDFGANFARAREEGYDAIAAGCLEIADDAKNDWMETFAIDDDASAYKLNGEHIQRSKLRIETRLKLLAKWDPKRYGDKLALGGADDLPAFKVMADDQLLARIAALQSRLNAAKS